VHARQRNPSLIGICILFGLLLVAVAAIPLSAGPKGLPLITKGWTQGAVLPDAVDPSLQVSHFWCYGSNPGETNPALQGFVWVHFVLNNVPVGFSTPASVAYQIITPCSGGSPVSRTAALGTVTGGVAHFNDYINCCTDGVYQVTSAVATITVNGSSVQIEASNTPWTSGEIVSCCPGLVNTPTVTATPTETSVVPETPTPTATPTPGTGETILQVFDIKCYDGTNPIYQGWIYVQFTLSGLPGGFGFPATVAYQIITPCSGGSPVSRTAFPGARVGDVQYFLDLFTCCTDGTYQVTSAVATFMVDDSSTQVAATGLPWTSREIVSCCPPPSTPTPTATPTTIVCDDGDPCTIDTVVNGQCVYTPINCDDGDACTIDSCVAGECVHTPKDCSDGNVCTIDSCDPQTGECLHTPVN